MGGMGLFHNTYMWKWKKIISIIFNLFLSPFVLLAPHRTHTTQNCLNVDYKFEGVCVRIERKIRVDRILKDDDHQLRKLINKILSVVDSIFIGWISPLTFLFIYVGDEEGGGGEKCLVGGII